MTATSPFLNRPLRLEPEAALERLRDALNVALAAVVACEDAGVQDIGNSLRLINLGLQDSLSDCRGLLARYEEGAPCVRLFDEVAS